MPRSRRPVCVRCGLGVPGAFDAVPTCAACRARPPAFEAARAPWRYTGAVRDAVRLFKYRRHWRIGRWLAAEMAACAADAFPVRRIDVTLPVPLHWLKGRLRDAHPAAELGEAVAGRLRTPYRPAALASNRLTPGQTGLAWRARRQNVRGAFTAEARGVRGRTILLVDDVLTSGATVDACAAALRDAGARNVFVITAARTPLNTGARPGAFRARHSATEAGTAPRRRGGGRQECRRSADRRPAALMAAAPGRGDLRQPFFHQEP